MSMTTLAATHDSGSGCLICQSKDQQIQAKDEVIRAKDAVIAAKDDAIAQKDQALKAERELREQLQKQLKLASAGVTKKASLINIKSASSQAQEEKDALTIYIRNVTESVTYEMLHDAFSVFGTIRTLNVVHPKACAFVEFATPDAHQKALAATSVPVGDGHENVLTEKRVRKPQQTAGGGFTRRPSTNNLKSFASSGNLQASYNNSSNNSNSNSNNNSHTHHMISTAAAAPTHTGTANSYHSMTKMNSKGTELHTKEDEGCDLTATC
ncbi:MAG: hypothetical protein JOS17DRAFT_519178 [Linnemannia elongata]|nr:MAG: hypothetical protein JOS17DRAFT_519178 [Linnemannia elongata]